MGCTEVLMFYGEENCGGFKNECEGCESCEETVRQTVRRVVSRRCPTLPRALPGDVVVRTTGFVYQSGGGPRLRYLPARQEVAVLGPAHGQAKVGTGADARWFKENPELAPYVKDRREVLWAIPFWMDARLSPNSLPALLDGWLEKAEAFKARWGHEWADGDRTVESVRADMVRSQEERVERARRENELYMQNFWAKGAQVGTEFKWNGQTLRKTSAGRSVPSFYTDANGDSQEYYGTAFVFGAVNVETGENLFIRVE